MKIFLASDHAGYSLKESVKEYLVAKGYDATDLGPDTYDAQDDYPYYIARVARKVSASPDTTFGIVFGGSGQGEAIVANRFPHVRAVVYAGDVRTNEAEGHDMVTLTREHNNANIFSVGARFVEKEEVIGAIERWLSTPFTRDERHVRRIEQIEVCLSDDAGNQDQVI